MVQVIVHHKLHLVEFAFEDGYSAASLKGLNVRLGKAAIVAKGSGDYFDILADFSHHGVMPQDTSKASEERIAWCLANGLRKSANITTSAIMKMQIQRIAPNPGFQFFTSRQDALDWLALPVEAC